MALPELITVEELFAPPERTGAEISPDGTRIAYLAPWRNRLNVWVRGIDSEDDARCVTADETRSVAGFHWTDDPRWLLYLQDSGGDENWHVYRIDLNDPGSPAVDLTPFPGVRTWGLELPVGRPGKAIVQLNTRTVGEIDLHEVDIATGELTLLARNPGQVITWLCAPDGELHGQTLTAEGDIELSRWDATTGALSPIVVFDGSDYPLSISPLQLTPDGTGVWIGSNRDTDRTRLVRLDLATGVETEVDNHPTLDLAPAPYPSLITHPRTGELRGVRYLGERQVIRALDPHFAEVLEKVGTLSGGDVAAMSSDDEGQRWVVAFNHDRDPGVTWFYDHSTGEARQLFRSHPHLDPEVMAPMVPVTIPARDGLSLPGYLTLPVGVEPTGLPLVLNVHGGPWVRDIWTFDPFVQLLANRGYAVLQVNFRGSSGYGKAHTRAAIGEFAGAMHDDLIDAVNWAVEQGYADRDRVGIYGGSYGGYAALVAVTFTPDVFAAAIDYCGISDLANFMRTMPPAVRAMMANNWYAYVGDPADPVQEADMLARSPISRVDEIRTPLMVVQGANDVRVVQAESDNIVASLRARGVDVEYMVKDDEGHGFVNPENQIDMYRAAEAFLARHLGGRDDTVRTGTARSAVLDGR
ncbi:S9 family peptidase [Pseudonocardia parietis]|uniref:Dipeptidyl aminopeptidase/acylaminoacyl peptidase n=1 Tax=Pseudonocardia parietis TaxID=570936 RepID=A0ABS4VLH5_9PSEU|nr:S9 family peptidase [Pseudonocardia parietis]MBP2364613.1 dipeptidyl aminopeptidase/acylaminoacyl peptidase [Pseudonocardia parietis]